MSSETTLRAFSKMCGDIDLAKVTEAEIREFLDMGLIAQITRISKFSALKCFVNYYADRGAMSAIQLIAPAKPKVFRAPFIYTHAQVKALLSATESCQSRAVDLDGRTLRMFLLLLYATGGTVDEMLSLRASGVDLRLRRVSLNATACRRGRVLPMSAQLRDQLARHLRSNRGSSRDDYILQTSRGEQVRSKNLSVRFKMLLKLVDVNAGPHGQMPRLQDFRYTFAVHRLTSWIAAGADLDTLRPALSAYMGYRSLTKAEDFLALTPERFRSDLEKLAARHSRPRWKTDQVLMAFLKRL